MRSRLFLASLSLALAPCVLATPKQGTVTSALPQGAAQDDKVTAASLPGLLKGLGYEPEKVGETSQRVTIERDKYTFRINFSVSGNLKKVWMSSYLIQIPDLSKVPANLLSDALIANGNTGPAHYYLVKVEDKHWLKMGFALDNRSITPAYLRSELDWFMDRMAETASVWDKAKWDAAIKG